MPSNMLEERGRSKKSRSRSASSKSSSSSKSSRSRSSSRSGAGSAQNPADQEAEALPSLKVVEAQFGLFQDQGHAQAADPGAGVDQRV